jgi:hypothetical protein
MNQPWLTTIDWPVKAVLMNHATNGFVEHIAMIAGFILAALIGYAK